MDITWDEWIFSLDNRIAFNVNLFCDKWLGYYNRSHFFFNNQMPYFIYLSNVKIIISSFPIINFITN